MPSAPGPEEAYQWYEQEIDLLTSAARTGAPTQDVHSAFFALPHDRREVLVGATPSFEHVQPVWQLRVGDFRVIYDVDEKDRRVTVRAVLHKGSKTTGEIL